MRKIWRALQSEWSTCQCSCNTGSIIDILPPMPHQLLLHPLKLKCKLEYKSHCMYDVICRDKVINAITWLKEHNYLYANIKVNEECQNSDLAADLLRIQVMTEC